MTAQVERSEQRILILAQNLADVFADVDQTTGERAMRTAFMAKGWIPRDLLVPDEIVVAADSPPNRMQYATAFFDRGEKLKPAQNAFLCAAFYYSQYGGQAFSVEEIREIARNAGLILPDRVDMTFKAAGGSGKKYFQPVDKGRFKFTLHGELYVREQWDVKPGKLKHAKDQR